MKFQKFTESGCKDNGKRKFESVAKTRLLCSVIIGKCFQTRLNQIQSLNVELFISNKDLLLFLGQGLVV